MQMQKWIVGFYPAICIYAGLQNQPDKGHLQYNISFQRINRFHLSHLICESVIAYIRLAAARTAHNTKQKALTGRESFSSPR